MLFHVLKNARYRTGYAAEFRTMLALVKRLFSHEPVAGYTRAESLDSCFRKASENPFKGQYDVASLSGLTAATLPAHLLDLLKMIRKLNLASPKILSVGCGAGQSRRALALAGVKCDYRGCDIDARALAVAKDYFGDDRIINADATALPFQDDEFDICVLEGSLQYIRDYGLALQEAARVGKAIIINRATMTRGSTDLYYNRVGSYIDGVIAEIHISEPKLEAALKALGFRIAQTSTLSSREVADGEVCFLRSYLCVTSPSSP